MKNLEIKLNELSPVELKNLYNTLKGIDIDLAVQIKDYLNIEYKLSLEQI